MITTRATRESSAGRRGPLPLGAFLVLAHERSAFGFEAGNRAIDGRQPFAIAGRAGSDLETVMRGAAARDVCRRRAVVAPGLAVNPLAPVATVVDALVASELRQGLVGEIRPLGASVFGPVASVNRSCLLSATLGWRVGVGS
jgi:hypothetical protein